MSASSRGKRTQNLAILAATVTALASLPPAARAQTHTFDLATGTNGNGVLKSKGRDPDWIVTAWQQEGTNFKLPLDASIVVPGDADWWSNWVQDFTTYPSRWIAPDPACQHCNGNFTLTYTFDLTGYDLATATFSNLYWAIDDQGYLALNGTTLATLPHDSFGAMTAFTIPISALVQGVNTLTITSVNSDYLSEGARLEGSLTISPAGPGFTTLYSFHGTNDGAAPNGALTMGAGGVLFGGTYSGGTANAGTLFSFAPATNQLTTLYQFSGTTDGGQPVLKLAVGQDGALYGATQYGGSANSGTIFKLASGTNKLTTLYAFQGKSDGADPGGGLAIESNGQLVGNAITGGAYNFGAIFQVNPANLSETPTFSFNGAANGGTPGLIDLASGLVYGSSKQGGGASGAGTLYSLNPRTGKLATLYKFTGGADGTAPTSEFVMDANNNLYGTTFGGGISGAGTIFRFNVQSKTLTTLYSFTGGADGANPLGGVLLAGATTLYGTTAAKGADNEGTLFSLDITTGQLTTLHSFTGGADGGPPNHAPVLDQAGDVIGTTRTGGTGGFGTIFKYVP